MIMFPVKTLSECNVVICYAICIYRLKIKKSFCNERFVGFVFTVIEVCCGVYRGG